MRSNNHIPGQTIQYANESLNARSIDTGFFPEQAGCVKRSRKLAALRRSRAGRGPAAVAMFSARDRPARVLELRAPRGDQERRASVPCRLFRVKVMGEPQASLLLKKQLAELRRLPVEGFSAGLVNDDDIYKWEVLVIGPPDTLYEGGFFKAILDFPKDYPQKPPKMKFVSEIWHPNIDKDGHVCISILHDPGDDK
ncbi:hypothetical protein Y032_0155g3057 [Ancylostoma ceylanicum]|uniref:UBC core domain-containing protein n=2 Tax=Ancylostoma ceylanicum TaxID=53326 RepID=A0A016SZV2_9BILA|nr:hypothetical protein Y032_0155g3057 [Ancylostoma ceylanicum]